MTNEQVILKLVEKNNPLPLQKAARVARWEKL